MTIQNTTIQNIQNKGHLYIFNKKQVRTNIGLADTLIPFSFIYLIYMGDTGPWEPMTIISGSVI